MILISSALMIFFLINSSLAYEAGDIVVAYDCGNPEPYTGTHGVQYTPDSKYTQGTHVADYLQSFDSRKFRFSLDPFVYLTERHSDKTFSYMINIYEDGVYTLNLKFAELYFKE